MVVYLRYAGVYGYWGKYCREGLRNFHSLEEERERNFCEQKERQEKGKSLDLHCHEFNKIQQPCDSVTLSHSYLPEYGSLDGALSILLAVP